MKAHLLLPDADFAWSAPPPWNAAALRTDLALDVLFDAMGNEDDVVRTASQKVLLAAMDTDLTVIKHRQGVLVDCLKNPNVVHELYRVTCEIADVARRRTLGRTLARYPEWVLRYGVEVMEIFFGYLRQLRKIADREASRFTSDGWTRLFQSLQTELSNDFFERAKGHVREFKEYSGLVMSAGLGPANIATDFVLHRLLHRLEPSFWRRFVEWLFPRPAPPNSFDIHPLDESGVRALEGIRAHGLAVAARTLARAADHVLAFFAELREELAFYVGCLNLRDRLQAKGEPLAIPELARPEERCWSCVGLYDVALALTLADRVVGNDVMADGCSLIMVTGANQGGKSTFLRSVGLAQLMTQAGLFAPAKSFRTSLADGIFTHYKREEDTALKAGKLDEELQRMSDIVDHLSRRPLVLLNESFAATNEREGSEIARQIIAALKNTGAQMFCVTHLYELARRFAQPALPDVLFLRAERRSDGARTYRVVEGQPLQTSFAEDLYRQVFGTADGASERPDQSSRTSAVTAGRGNAA